MDKSRTGSLPFVFEPGMGFERYVDYAMDVPMYFVYRWAGGLYDRSRAAARSGWGYRDTGRGCICEGCSNHVRRRGEMHARNGVHATPHLRTICALQGRQVHQRPGSVVEGLHGRQAACAAWWVAGLCQIRSPAVAAGAMALHASSKQLSLWPVATALYQR